MEATEAEWERVIERQLAHLNVATKDQEAQKSRIAIHDHFAPAGKERQYILLAPTGNRRSNTLADRSRRHANPLTHAVGRDAAL